MTKKHEDRPAIKCDATLDEALAASLEAYKRNIGVIGETICEVARRQTAETDGKLSDLRTFIDNGDTVILNIVQTLQSQVDDLAHVAAGKTEDEIKAIADAAAAAAVAAALNANPSHIEELNILLTLVQEAPELRNIAALIARISDLEKRVEAVEANALTLEDVDCRSIAAVVRLADLLSGTMATFRADVMNCIYPQSTETVSVS